MPLKYLSFIVYGLSFSCLSAHIEPGLLAMPTAQSLQLENEKALKAAECLHTLCDRFFDYSMTEFPETATFVGWPGCHGKWTDCSFEAIARREIALKNFLEALASIAPADLPVSEQINHALLKHELLEWQQSISFKSHYMPVNQMDGVHLDVQRIISIMPTDTVEQYQNILERLEGVPLLIDQNIELLKKGLELGITPPQLTLRDVPQQVLNQISPDPIQSILFQPFRSFSNSLSSLEKEVLVEKAKKVLQHKVFPAFNKFYTFLVQDYIPGCRTTLGLSDLPNGKAWYAYRVRSSTTTQLTPEEIHEIGMKEVKRIRQAMKQIVDEISFNGSLDDFVLYLKEDPVFYFKDRESLLTAYRDIVKRIESALPQLFGKLPHLPFEIIPVPSHSEKSQPAAYYMPGSVKAGRPGYFYLNAYDLKRRPKWEMETLTLHEAIPGHHLQISLAQEMDELPNFRKYSNYTAYVEGWGLYSESLGKELGLYQNPYFQFGRLTFEMLRAVRLVVDTGLHALGWSRQQAIDFFKTYVGINEHEIITEIDRYLVMPGQALAYKIGERKIKELRALASQTLGENFDIRAFHDEILGNGALPLDILENHMKKWMQNR